MAWVVLGVDPAKRSHTVAVLDSAETELAALRVGNDNAGYRRCSGWLREDTRGRL